MKYIFTVIILLYGVFAMAQIKLNIDSCRNRALKYSEELKIAEKKQKASIEEKKSYRANFLPKLSASANYIYKPEALEYTTQETYLPTYTPDLATGELNPNIAINPMTGEPIIGPDGNPVFNQYAWMPQQNFKLELKNTILADISLEQPLFFGGKIVTAYKMAEIGSEMAQLNIKKTHEEIILETDKAYWTYVSLIEKVKLAEIYLELLDSLERQVKNAYETGMVHRNKLLNVKVKKSEAKLKLQKAIDGKKLSKMYLCRIIGLPLNEKITVPDSEIVIDESTILINDTLSPELRSDYQLLSKKSELKQQNINLARADYLPQLGLKASYSYFDGAEFYDKNISNQGFMVMASIKIPIWNWGKGKNKITAAQIESESVNYEVQKYEKMMILEMHQRKFELQNAYREVKSNEIAMELAKENLQLSKNAYETGMEILTNYMEAQTQWQKAHSNLIDAKINCKIKQTAYLKATGRLNYKF